MKFQDFNEGKSPLEALKKFSFKLRYKVSDDVEYICGYDDNKKIVIGFHKVRLFDFDTLREW